MRQDKPGLREILGFLRIKLPIEVSIPILLKKYIIRRVPMIQLLPLLIVPELIALTLKDAIFTMIKAMG